MKNPMIPVIVVAIAVAVAAFFGGMKYQQMKQPAGFAAGGNAGFGAGPGGQRAGRGGQAGQGLAGSNGQMMRFGNGGARPVLGEIIAQDDTSITVKLADGSSKIVVIPESASLNKSAAATKADLKVGERVNVFGTENADGSVTAQNVQLNPVMRMASGSGVPSPSGQPK